MAWAVSRTAVTAPPAATVTLTERSAELASAVAAVTAARSCSTRSSRSERSPDAGLAEAMPSLPARDDVLRCPVAGHRAAVDQGVLVRVGQGPRPYRPAGGEPPTQHVAAIDSRVGPLDGISERVVRVQDQRGQQVVPAGEVPVQRRGDHAEIPGDRPQ